MLATGRYKKALVIGAEKLTSLTDYQDRTTCILFGDGAGAVVLGTQPGTGQGIIGTKLYAGAPPADAEALIEDVNDIIALGRVLRQGGPDPIDLQELSDALSEAVRIAERIEGRLSGGEG
jgi:3-oxoacyl-[acyl-carrier-protein] synthase-3